MNTKVQVNPDFKNAEEFLRTLPTTFANNGQTLKNDRNEIKIIEHNGVKFCVKSFNRVTAFNRYMYSWFRATKAKRSYNIGRRLEQAGIETPQPVAYVEVYQKWHILHKAYYVSLYLDHQFDMKDVLEKSIDCQENILSSFAHEMATVVHPAGAWHNDLSQGNILINRVEKDDWSFSFIDLNRLTFKRNISPTRGLINLKKLTNNPVAIALIAEQYAISADKSPRFYSLLLQRFNLHFSIRRIFTKKVLSIFKPHNK